MGTGPARIPGFGSLIGDGTRDVMGDDYPTAIRALMDRGSSSASAILGMFAPRTEGSSLTSDTGSGTIPYGLANGLGDGYFLATFTLTGEITYVYDNPGGLRIQKGLLDVTFGDGIRPKRGYDEWVCAEDPGSAAASARVGLQLVAVAQDLDALAADWSLNTTAPDVTISFSYETEVTRLTSGL